jgi:hypothetical protein
MKTLKNLVKTETLNVEELMMIKGAAEDAAPVCKEHACTSVGCSGTLCTSSGCTSSACSSVSCGCGTCRNLGCFSSQGNIAMSVEKNYC